MLRYRARNGFLKYLVCFSVLAAGTGLRSAHASYYASSLDSRPRFYLGLGLISQDSGRISGSSLGATSLFASLYTQVTATGVLSLSDSWGLSPTVAYTPLGRGSPDGGETMRILSAGLRVYRLFDPLDVHLGPGALWYTISGSGGTTVLNNGASTLTFGLPSGSTTSTAYFINAGVGFALFSSLRLDLDAWVTGALSSKRAVDLVVTASYGLF